MATLELLEAVNMRSVRTPDHVAATLGVSEADAMRQLQEAEGGGLVSVEVDESRNSVPPDFQRRFLQLTEAGFAEMHRLQAEQAAG